MNMVLKPLTEQQQTILDEIIKHPGITVTEIAQIVGLPKSRVWVAIASYEPRGIKLMEHNESLTIYRIEEPRHEERPTRTQATDFVLSDTRLS